MDLQCCAAEDEGRTEEPSEYKIQKAREEGRVAKSQELVGALGLLLPTLTILVMAPYFLRTCIEMIRFFFLRAHTINIMTSQILGEAFFRYFIRLTLPIAVVAVAAAVFSNVVQTGFLYSTKPITPDFSKLIPHFGQYFQRTLFSMEGLYNLGKSIVKMGIIGGVAFYIIWSRRNELANLQTAGLWQGFEFISGLTIRMLLICAILLLILSIPDMLFQRWQYRESLKMTVQEVKEERKMYEGDPMIRSRLRQRMRELLQRNIAAVVPRANVVVTNPTHYAVALEYQEGIRTFDGRAAAAPIVTAKGYDPDGVRGLAYRIRTLARENGVPSVETMPLAHALYREVDVGQEVPVKYWQVVANVLASVQRINEERWARAGERRTA
jgi:flagellar biosynthetic protein FlhB